MKHSRFFSISVAILLGGYGLMGFYFLPWANFAGDMTRMAMLPESMFARTKEQPVINRNDMRSAAWEDAEVLVIGDSFSMAQAWQSVFNQHGKRVRTESWGNINKLCGDMSEWVRSKGFNGKYIVIESAEMNFEARLADSLECQHTIYHPLRSVAVTSQPALPDLKSNRYSGRMSVGIRTAWNAFEYERMSRKSDFKHWDMPGDVWVERLAEGCDLFTHARCNDVLFYKKFRASDLGDNVLRDMKMVNTRLNGYTVVWAVIPDKSTVYLRQDKRFWDEAERRFGAPNLLRLYRQALHNKTVDLYLGNDTHVSTAGYLLLGNELYRHLYR